MSVRFKPADRRSFIGGSDARIIMGDDEAALHPALAREAGRGRAGGPLRQPHRPARRSSTEPLNRLWYERNTGQAIDRVQRRVRHPVLRWMGATLDGMVAGSGAVFEAKFMLPWSFSEEGAAEKHMAQLQHNMWVTNAKLSALSIITGGGKWVEITHHGGSALPAPAAHRREEVLALRRERRAPSPVRRRAAAAAHRSGPDRRYERVQCLGGVRRGVLLDPLGLSRAREGQGRAQGADAGGRQGGDRPRRSGQALEIRRHQLRSARAQEGSHAALQ